MAKKEINEEKLKALQLTMEKLDKAYGKGSVMKLGDAPVEKVDVIPTGSLTLDLALGINGYPKGRVVEIYGPESSGKTFLKNKLYIMQYTLQLNIFRENIHCNLNK
jgi:recombination protein RecA